MKKFRVTYTEALDVFGKKINKTFIIRVESLEAAQKRCESFSKTSLVSIEEIS